MSKSLLVTLADENYLDQAKQLFSSVYFNSDWNGDYMLLAHEIPEDKLVWFKNKGILIKKCKALSKGNVGKMPSVTLSKFYLFTIEFKKWDRVVFLDADIIVRFPLEQLTKVRGFAAVKDGPFKLDYGFITKGKNVNIKKLTSNYDLNIMSFNSGVFVFSTDIIKKDSFQKLKELTRLYKDLSIYGEQGILNLFFYKKWNNLPRVYNVPPYLATSSYLTKKKSDFKGILHFVGDHKPWDKKDPFHESWRLGLDRVDEINLNERRSLENGWTKKEVIDYNRRLEKKIAFLVPVRYLDYLIGQVGIFLRKYLPKGYFFSSLFIKSPKFQFKEIIETNRNSKALFWKFVIYCKDLCWYLCSRKGLKKDLAQISHLDYFYYKFIYGRKIFFSKPVMCSKFENFELHILTCKKDFLDSMWSIKSFFHYSGLRPVVVIHDDGSLRNCHIKSFRKHVKNCKIITKKYADIKIKNFLESYPKSLKYRSMGVFYCAIKLFDPLLFSESRNILLLDSDILFFRKPEGLIDMIKNNKPFFLNDSFDSYAFPKKYLNKKFKIDVVNKLNAGLIFFKKKDYLDNLNFVEKYFCVVDENKPCVNLNRHEQTLHALLSTKFNSLRLDDSYQISKQKITRETVCHHFVDDNSISRSNFYRLGLRLLKFNKFLNEAKLK